MKQQRLSVVYLGMGVMLALVVSMLLSSVIPTYASTDWKREYENSELTKKTKCPNVFDLKKTDNLSYFPCECTSYVAFRLAQAGVSANHYRENGHAKEWVSRAKAKGIQTGLKPLKGAVYVIQNGTFGHVMFVEEVQSNLRIRVSEYNRDNSRNYSNNKWIDPSRSGEFIYFSNVSSNNNGGGGNNPAPSLAIVSPVENGTTENGLIRITWSGGKAPYYLEVYRKGSSSAFIYQYVNSTTYQPSILSWSQSYSGSLCARVTDANKKATALRCFSNGSNNGGGGNNSTPSKPKGLQIKDIGSTKAKIDWDSQSGVGYFCVNWSRDNVTPNGCDVKVKGSDSSYKPTDLKANKTYYVWIQSCNNNGACSSAAKTDFKTKK